MNSPAGAVTVDERAVSDAPESAADVVAARPIVGRKLHAAVLVVCVLLLVGAHVMTIGYVKFANVDESYAAAIAKRILDGYRLYEGAVSQRGPLMYYSFCVVAKLFGWDNILAIRFLALGLAVAHVLLTWWVALRLFGRDVALLAAFMIAYALAIGFPPDDGLAANGETLLIPMLLVGAGVGALALRSEIGTHARRQRLVIAGLALGAALCTKQTAFIQVVPVAVWLVADARTRGQLRRGASDLAVFVASSVAIPALFTLQAWRAGTLKSFIYYAVTFNLSIHTRPFQREPLVYRWFERMQDQPLFTASLALLAAIVVSRWWPRVYATFRYREPLAFLDGFDVRDYVMQHAVLALAVAARAPQLYPHYFLVPLPFIAITVAQACVGLVEGPRLERAFTRVLVACSVVSLVMAADIAYLREKIDGRFTHDRTPELAARYIQRTTPDDAKIFVWGFSPWIYEYSHRVPAGRFVFATYVTGFIPWFWEGLANEYKNVVPGAMTALLDDLDREKPEVVVDAGSVMIARSMRAYPDSSAWLHANYCFDARVGPFDIYRRKHEGSACLTDYFPYTAFPVDNFSRPLPALAAMTLDFPESRPLPPGDYLQPIRFDPPRECGGGQLWSQSSVDVPETTCNFGGRAHLDEDDPLRPMCSYPCPLPFPSQP